MRNPVNRVFLLLLSLILLFLLFSFFTVRPPVLQQSGGERAVGSREPVVNVPAVRFVVKVEHEIDNTISPVPRMLVKIRNKVLLTDGDGRAEFFLIPAVYTIVVMSPLGKLPTWREQIPISAPLTVLNIRYIEYRQRPMGVDVALDFYNLTSDVTLSYKVPYYKEMKFGYVGTPLIVFLGEGYEKKYYLNELVIKWRGAENIEYRGAFLSLTNDLLNTTTTIKSRVNELVWYVITRESYVPIFFIEAEVKEMR